MKVIIAGGRNERLTERRKDILYSYIEDISEVVSGCATGIDSDAIKWAKENDIEWKEFPTDWSNVSCLDAEIRINKFGKEYDALAGLRRNKQMAKYADAVVLFRGGRGTDNMFKTAQKYGLIIYDHRNE